MPAYVLSGHTVVLKADHVWSTAAAATEPDVVDGSKEAVVRRITQHLIELCAATHKTSGYALITAVVEPYQLVAQCHVITTEATLRLEEGDRGRVSALEIDRARDIGSDAGEEGNTQLWRRLRERGARGEGADHPLA